MPAVSRAQQHLMGAAEHGAQFPMAQKLRQSMTLRQLHDFASGSMKGKPAHVAKAKGARMRGAGSAMHPLRNLRHYGSLPHPHKNLGTFLHPKKG